MKQALTRTKGAAECLPTVAIIGTVLACLRAREADAITGLQLRMATEAIVALAIILNSLKTFDRSFSSSRLVYGERLECQAFKKK